MENRAYTPSPVRASTYEDPIGERSPPDRSSASLPSIDSDERNEDIESASGDEQVSSPHSNVTTTSNGIALPNEPIVALGNEPGNPQVPRAYTRKDYPSISRSSIQMVKDTQAQYSDSLASTDVLSLLGNPFSEIVYGSGLCADGQSGDISTYYYLIRDSNVPKSIAVVRFCADGMQSITTQRLQ